MRAVTKRLRHLVLFVLSVKYFFEGKINILPSSSKIDHDFLLNSFIILDFNSF